MGYLTTNYYQTEDEWQTVKINTLPWQGQSIKLRIEHQYGKVAVDEIGLQKVTLPGWQVTEGTVEIVTEPDGQKLMSVKGRVQSDEFVVPGNRQHITLGFRLKGPWCLTIPTLNASIGVIARQRHHQQLCLGPSTG